VTPSTTIPATVPPNTVEHLTDPVDGVVYPITTDYGSLNGTAASLPPYVATVLPDTTDQSGNGPSTAITDYGAASPVTTTTGELPDSP